MIDTLNFHHLRYFWVAAREGGITQAGKLLRLSHPTLSAQIHMLEDFVGQKLFEKSGRRLVLTPTGELFYRYADEIFSLGREMLDAAEGKSVGQSVRLNVGISDVVPKLIVRRLLQPALHLSESVRLVCYEDRFDRLLADLALHSLDLVISDAPIPPGASIRGYAHLLGECGVTFFAAPAIARNLKGKFPKSLDGAPILLPLENLPLRRSLNQWFDSTGVRPKVTGEFEDSALLKVFGGDGLGVFPGPSVIAKEIEEQYGVKRIGRTDAVRERFYAISSERRLKNPAVVAISDAARTEMFGG